MRNNHASNIAMLMKGLFWLMVLIPSTAYLPTRQEWLSHIGNCNFLSATRNLNYGRKLMSRKLRSMSATWEEAVVLHPLAQAVFQSLQQSTFQRLHCKQNTHLLPKDLKLAFDRFHVRAIKDIIVSRNSQENSTGPPFRLELQYKFLSHAQVKHWSISSLQDLEEQLQTLLEQVSFKKVMLTTAMGDNGGKAVQEFVLQRSPLPPRASTSTGTDSHVQCKYNVTGLKTKTVQQYLPTDTISPSVSTSSDSPEGYISVDEPFLVLLNITTPVIIGSTNKKMQSFPEKRDNGKTKMRLKSNKVDKFKQINKFVEILHHLVDKVLSQRAGITELEIVDMGCGKGYLTFAAHVYFSRLLTSQHIQVCTTGIELQPHLVRHSNVAVAALRLQEAKVDTSSMYDSITFVQGDIAGISSNPTILLKSSPEVREEESSKKLKVLVALHACDTLTDEALFTGTQQHFDLIVASPCCHKEVRRQLESQQLESPSSLLSARDDDNSRVLNELMQHGIYRERLSEMITDTIRAKALEACGYHTQVMEYIDQEATAKNTMITAVRTKSSPNDRFEANLQEVQQMMDRYRLSSQRLINLIMSSKDSNMRGLDNRGMVPRWPRILERKS